MEKQYNAQAVTVKNGLVIKRNYIGFIREGKIFLKSKCRKDKKYGIENIFNYGDEKLIKIKEEKDFSLSILMSFAGAILLSFNFILGLTLFSFSIVDVLKKRDFKYIILKEIETKTKKQTAKLLKFVKCEKIKKAA